MASGRQRQQVFLGEEIAQKREFSEETQREVDQAVRRIVEEAYERASTTLTERRDVLDRVAEALLEKEELPGDAVMELLDGGESEDGDAADTAEAEPDVEDEAAPEKEGAGN